MMAYHCYEGEDWPKALNYLAKAGDKATAAYANREALDYYARAFEVCKKLGASTLSNSVELAKRRGLVNGTIGDFQGAIVDFNRMLTAARSLADQHLEGMAMAYLGWAEQQYYDEEAAEDTLVSTTVAGIAQGKLIVALNDEGGPVRGRTGSSMKLVVKLVRESGRVLLCLIERTCGFTVDGGGDRQHTVNDCGSEDAVVVDLPLGGVEGALPDARRHLIAQAAGGEDDTLVVAFGAIAQQRRRQGCVGGDEHVMRPVYLEAMNIVLDYGYTKAAPLQFGDQLFQKGGFA